MIILQGVLYCFVRFSVDGGGSLSSSLLGSSGLFNEISLLPKSFACQTFAPKYVPNTMEINVIYSVPARMTSGVSALNAKAEINGGNNTIIVAEIKA